MRVDGRADCGDPSLSGLIAAEFLEALGGAAEAVEAAIEASGAGEDEVQKEDVLPRLAGTGARLDLGEVEFGGAEDPRALR